MFSACNPSKLQRTLTRQQALRHRRMKEIDMEIVKSRNQLVVDLSNHQKDNIGYASSLCKRRSRTLRSL
jgi:hypothetical protein